MIDELLNRALLLEEPCIPRDVVPDVAPPAPLDADTPCLVPAARSRHEASHAAAHNLQTLCETVVTHTAATSLQEFVTEQLPEPSGARVLGCILQLTDAEDSARFWWQYAAGAGDDAASYCLYLHHLSLGETDAAAWWRKQTRIDTQPDPETGSPRDSEQASGLEWDSSTPTVLRVLGQLLTRVDRPRSEVFDAVMDYVPGAVAIGYLANPDFEIPLPGPDFADHIGIILAATSALHTGPFRSKPPGTSPKLPGRQEHTRAEAPPAEQPARGHR
ncbi:hypothetical protein [Actinacidiphila oryziradicis]|uniref:Uncharacterized protein n=1 Tax=Actinacidiphila oryziradicis TaxID=2571141 RepID=A0A4U0S8P5_9ACTN|nr:hypothetical protein [Actinacidiphila oryziradicis]TJZ96754.1 hypothetical protein FCI23_50595 [Actinacidiphila oryziradicis]